MFGTQMIGMMVATVLALGAVPVKGQAQVDVLIFQSGGTQHGVSASAALGYRWVRATRGPFFLEQLRIPNKWELVIFELPDDRVTQKAEVAQLLEDHVAAGGRLLVNYNNLDEWPRLQTLLGLDDAIEMLIPQDVLPTEPRYASYPPPGDTFPWLQSVWADFGDQLVPSPAGIAVGLYEDNSVSIVIANEGRTIVNGFDWDSYPPVSFFAKHEVEYLMTCRADLDQSTGAAVLDIFDFLAFQDLFVRQDPLANMVFDPNFDIFDFLAFQDAFVNGCA